jgi:hypothetical protein
MRSLKGGPRLGAIDLSFKQKYSAKQRIGANLRKIPAPQAREHHVGGEYAVYMMT